jgi:hypothetical protein
MTLSFESPELQDCLQYVVVVLMRGVSRFSACVFLAQLVECACRPGGIDAISWPLTLSFLRERQHISIDGDCGACGLSAENKFKYAITQLNQTTKATRAFNHVPEV